MGFTYCTYVLNNPNVVSSITDGVHNLMSLAFFVRLSLRMSRCDVAVWVPLVMEGNGQQRSAAPLTSSFPRPTVCATPAILKLRVQRAGILGIQVELPTRSRRYGRHSIVRRYRYLHLHISTLCTLHFDSAGDARYEMPFNCAAATLASRDSSLQICTTCGPVDMHSNAVDT